MELDSVHTDKKLKHYLNEIWPEGISVRLDKKSPEFKQLEEIAKSDFLNTKNLALTIVVTYKLVGFEFEEGKPSSALFRSEPVCNTDNQKDWWWTTQRNTEPFKDLLRKMTGTEENILIPLPGEVEQVIIPSMNEAEDELDEPGLFLRERKYWRFVK